MPKSSRLHVVLVAGTAVAALIGGAANAQQATTQEGPPTQQPAQQKQQQATGGVETVVVTAQKRQENIQHVPIAISAFSQKELKSEQVAGGPDLVKQVPNLTFSKTNFTGYNIQIRGIGTQAISVTTDPAVAVAFNDTPFIRNHFFEQEFYDVARSKCCAGRKARSMAATRRRAWSISFPPSRPISSKRMAPSMSAITRTAASKACSIFPLSATNLICAWRANGPSATATRSTSRPSKRSTAAICGRAVCRLLFSRSKSFKANLVWEHFSEERRSRALRQAALREGSRAPRWSMGRRDRSKSDCRRISARQWLTQGCVPGLALWADRVPNAECRRHSRSSPRWSCSRPMSRRARIPMRAWRSRTICASSIRCSIRNTGRRTTRSNSMPITTSRPALTLTSQTGYNKDFLYSTEDYNRFNTAPDLHRSRRITRSSDGTASFAIRNWAARHGGRRGRVPGTCVAILPGIAAGLEFQGPFNFSRGRQLSALPDGRGLLRLLQRHHPVHRIRQRASTAATRIRATPATSRSIPALANSCDPIPADPNNLDQTLLGLGCAYIDPNPLAKVDGQGHNYFRSQNPYR